MRLLVQRVETASVEVDGKAIAQIGPGLLVLLGIHKNDTEKPISWLVNRLIHLRIFNDEQDKMNLSVQDIQGELLIVSQFTLYADCAAGRRPDLFHAAGGAHAVELYNGFLRELRQLFPRVQTGEFGAAMKVNLCNDGPVTMLIERD